jgi:glycosyltransferase involved in cell wall biosynthesis
MDAWVRSKIKGILILCGRAQKEILDLCANYLKRDDIIHIDHTDEISPLYKSVDFFVLPSLEEGSPLVIYEAMGNGLPIVTSPMGAGAVVRDGVEGIVLDPYDFNGWVEALKKLAEDKGLRTKFRVAALERAQEFTWEKVGQRRRELLLKVLGPLK